MLLVNKVPICDEHLSKHLIVSEWDKPFSSAYEENTGNHFFLLFFMEFIGVTLVKSDI